MLENTMGCRVLGFVLFASKSGNGDRHEGSGRSGGRLRGGRHGILDAADAVVSNYLLPFGGILIALFVGWKLKMGEALSESELGQGWLGLIWLWLLRVLAPLTLATILLRSATAL